MTSLFSSNFYGFTDNVRVCSGGTKVLKVQDHLHTF
jgi:hypothetical protein